MPNSKADAAKSAPDAGTPDWVVRACTSRYPESVIRAMGMTTVAQGARLGRPSLYKSLSGG